MFKNIIFGFTLLASMSCCANDQECISIEKNLLKCVGKVYKPFGSITYERIYNDKKDFVGGTFIGINSGYKLFGKVYVIFNIAKKHWEIRDENKIFLVFLSDEINIPTVISIDERRWSFKVLGVFQPVTQPGLATEVENTLSLVIDLID